MELAPELMFNALPNSGESGSLMTKVDWANTSLGHPSQWPARLSTAVRYAKRKLVFTGSICLISRFPIVLLCGPDFVLIYNDSYAPMLGQKVLVFESYLIVRSILKHWANQVTKCGVKYGTLLVGIYLHPSNLLGPMLQGVRDTGNPTWSDDLLLVINRTGYLEEAYFTFSYT